MHDVSLSRVTLRFSDFEVDLRAGELRKDGTKVKLQEQPFQILQVLLEHPGEVVTREELQRRIWPADTFVDFDHGLYNAIKRLREALGDTASTPRFIETLPKRGYRFIAPTERSGNNSHHMAAIPPVSEGSNAGAGFEAYGGSQGPGVSAVTRQRGFQVGARLLLKQYPSWVRLVAVLFVLASATLVTVLVLRARHGTEAGNQSPPPAVARPAESGGSDQPAAAQPPAVQPSGTPLEVTQVRFTRNGEFDVMVRNLGNTDLIIHKISIKKLQEPFGIVAGILKPSAKYHIPVADIPVGETKSLSVSFVVPARRADRFLIALDSPIVYLLEVTLHYNRNQKVSFTMETWHES